MARLADGWGPIAGLPASFPAPICLSPMLEGGLLVACGIELSAVSTASVNGASRPLAAAVLGSGGQLPLWHPKVLRLLLARGRRDAVVQGTRLLIARLEVLSHPESSLKMGNMPSLSGAADPSAAWLSSAFGHTGIFQ